MAWLEANYEMGQEMRQWVSPSLIEANYILSLSQQELQHVIEAEMAENPALELDNRPTCPVCDTVLEGGWCPTCKATQEPVTVSADTDDSMEDFAELPTSSIATREDDPEFDPMTLVASGETIFELIHANARMSLDEVDQPIAAYIIDSLDDRGFLTLPLRQIAKEFDVTTRQVETILEVVQDIAPVGVGARDLRECLLLQLDYLEEQHADVPPHARAIIESHLEDFGAHKFGQIARALGISVDEIDAVRDFIRQQLNPFPLQSDQAKSWRSPSDSRFVAPDVMIDLRNDALVVEVVDNRFFHLRTNPLYSQLAQEFGRKKKDASAPAEGTAEPAAVIAPDEVVEVSDEAIAETSRHDKDHVRQYANRARMFMLNIQQRRDTLLRISECICEFQEEFLRGGVRNLRPLTRAVVAQQVGVHESTVSRATANKFVMLPSRKVIPFSDFFTPSLSTKDVIKEIIEREQKTGGQLTDRQICDLLLEDGIRIARRTVAKYRAELGILPSTMR